MSRPRGSQGFLDEEKRQTVISMVANGSSRRVAARYVGCSPSTVTRTAARIPEFAERLVRAEQTAEINLLQRVQAAARLEQHWRAAAWLLERRNPEDFVLRKPRTFTPEQVVDLVGQLVDLLRGKLSSDDFQMAAEKLDALLVEFQGAEAPVVIQPAEHVAPS